MINYTDFFLGLFTASFASALGAYLNHLTNVSRLKKERKNTIRRYCLCSFDALIIVQDS